MKALVRQLLLILVAIALPLQGLAAVTMGICGGEHHGVTAPLASVPVEQHHDHHDHHAVMAQHDHSFAQDHQHHGSPDKQDKHKAACAACYAFSLPASMTLTTPALPRADHPVATVSRFIGYQPDGLERPPRPFLA
ncbi:hypothetical protein DLREEDagrD3_23280 [Denitratisoma sp. agr-D3]